MVKIARDREAAGSNPDSDKLYLLSPWCQGGGLGV